MHEENATMSKRWGGGAWYGNLIIAFNYREAGGLEVVFLPPPRRQSSTYGRMREC